MPKNVLRASQLWSKARIQPSEGEHSRPSADQLPQQPATTARPNGAGSQFVTLLVSSSVLLIAWQALVFLREIPPWLLPGPLDVLQRFRQVWADGTLIQHVIPTFIESMGGFCVALIIGSLLGYVVAHSPTLERWLAPYLAAIQAVPVIAVAPLIIIWLGYSSDISRNILVASIVVVFPIYSSTVAGIRGIPRELREVGLVEGASRWQRLRYIEVPLALPVLFSGFRTSLAYATTGAVVGEFLGSRYGLGSLINVARGLFDIPLIFVALVCLGLITLLFGMILFGLERLLLAWRD